MGKKYQTREERRKQLEAKKKAKRKQSKGKTIFKRIFFVIAILGIIGFLGGLGTFAYMVKDAPELDEELLKYPISSEIYDKDGELIAEIGAERRNYVEYDEIPELVRNAVLATEDVRFFEHHGLDYMRLAGAVVANFTDGFGSQGGSTITQQVVKNSFLTPEKTIKRKVQEAWLSFKLEQKYSKEQIFEMYVNKNWMGTGGHGIATAAKSYFGKELDELTLSEAATLAGIPQSPANFDPFTNPDKSEKRRNIVLSLMHQHGFITEAEMKEAQATKLTASLVPEEERKKGGIPYDAFIGHAIKEIKEKYPSIDPFSDGLKIYTTIDTKAQDYVDRLLNSNEIVKFPNEKIQAGITLLDTKTGEIRALGGGRNQTVTFGFNYATDAKRQPGSTFKPIFAYGPAIEYLKWGTFQMLEDKPYTYSNGTPISNWDNKHMGPMTARKALVLSRNIPALQATQAVGVPKAAEFTRNLGIDLKEPTEAYSIGGIGGEDKGVSTLEMAGAYSAFGNNGFYTEPHAVTHIELRDGTKLNLKPETTLAMHDYTAFMVSDMLKDVLTSGTGTQANIPGLPVAGKTGTTNYTKDEIRKHKIPPGAVPDSWFVGYTTDYSIAVWVGYDNKLKNGLVGREQQRLPQVIFKNLMSLVSKNNRPADFKMPNSVEKVRIVKDTLPAKLASENTPDDQVIIEYAVKGHGPKEVADFEGLIPPSKFEAAYDKAKNTIKLSWEHEDEDVEFELSVSINGQDEQLLTKTSARNFNYLPDGEGIYTFSLIAVREEETSQPVTATVKLVNEGKPEPGDDEPPSNGHNDGGNGHDDPGGNGNGGNDGGGDGGNNGGGDGDEEPEPGEDPPPPPPEPDPNDNNDEQ